MENQVFREKNLNRIASADDLHECMHVTSPRLWMLLVTILVLIAGFIVFACLVSIEEMVNTTAQVEVYTEKGGTFHDIQVNIPPTIVDAVHLGMEVRIEGKEGTVSGVFDTPATGNVATVDLKDPTQVLESRTYDAQIILETISPIQFLFH